MGAIATAEASCHPHMGSSSQYPSSMGLERGHRRKRAPGVPERGSTDPREGKGHTCLAKLLSKLVLRVSLSLSLSFWHSWENAGVRSSLWSLAQEKTAHLHLAFTNHFHWVWITAPSPPTFWVPSKASEQRVYNAGPWPGNRLDPKVDPHQPPLICPIRKRKQDSGF